MGIRQVTSLASSAFLESAVGTRDLQNQILNLNAQFPGNDVENYIYSWQTTYNKPIPSELSAARQRSWDDPIAERDFTDLLLNRTNGYDKARLRAASAKHSADYSSMLYPLHHVD